MRYLARFFVMMAVMAWFAARYALARLWCLRVPAGPERRAAVHRLEGVLLRKALSVLGATFVKLGQVASTRPDLLPQEIIDELRLLQDRMPPFPAALARRTIEEELGREGLERFIELDELPVAAASVAQVHRGRLRDGTEVAVKVLRPEVREQVERDASILLALARLMALHPGLRLSDPVGHLRELADGIHRQTDLRTEVENYERFRRDFADMPLVAFPRVLPELSTRRVLTMEFVRGRKLDALPAELHVAIAKRLEEVILRMCFQHAFVHADLHPGNMLLRDDGALVIFDVGLAKVIGPEVLDEFVDFSRCFAAGTARDFVEHMRRFHAYVGEVDWAKLEADIASFLAKVRIKNTHELELGPMFNEMYALARTYKVRPMADVVLVLVGVVTAEGIGKQLNPGGNIFEAISRFLLPLLDRRRREALATAS